MLADDTPSAPSLSGTALSTGILRADRDAPHVFPAYKTAKRRRLQKGPGGTAVRLPTTDSSSFPSGSALHRLAPGHRSKPATPEPVIS